MEEIQAIIELILSNKSDIILDFIRGFSYASGGYMMKIAAKVFSKKTK